jgi:hypothetical protein
MELKRLNQARTIGQVESFFPDDVSYCPEMYDSRLVAEALQNIGTLGAPLVSFGTVKPASITGGGIHPDNPNNVKSGDSFLLIQVDGGACYVIAPRKED